ncbi:MAG: hypothetical protein MJA30_06700 [Cytophagales bacterium]|nr:hypothetical protein [Cytophagales bacterium]
MRDKLKYQLRSNFSGGLFIVASELFAQEDVQDDLNRLEKTPLYKKLVENKRKEAQELKKST